MTGIARVFFFRKREVNEDGTFYNDSLGCGQHIAGFPAFTALCAGKSL